MLVRILRSLFSSRANRDDNSIAAMRSRATRMHREGRFPEAEIAYSVLLERWPDDSQALFYLGVACRQQGRLDEAFRHCHRALELAPGNPEWITSVGNLAAGLGKDEGVEACERRVIENADLATWLALGNALREAGRTREAEDAYRRCLEFAPTSPFAMRRLGSLLALSGRHDEADACFQISARAGLAPDPVMRLSGEFLSALERDRDRLLAGLPAMEGEWGNTRASIVVFACCDAVYFRKFAWALCSSTLRNAGLDCLVHIHVVNPEPTLHAEMERLRTGLGAGRIACTWEYTPLPEDDSAKTYYACARFLHLPRVIERYARPVLALDMDLLVVGSLDHVMQAAGDSDLAIIRWHETRWEPWEYFFATALMLRATPGTLAILQRVTLFVRHFLLREERIWLLDQIALFAAIECWPGRDPRERVCLLPPALAMLYGFHARPDEIPAGVVFWVVGYSLEDNREALTRRPFTDYLPQDQDAQPGGPMLQSAGVDLPRQPPGD